jgi:surface protein
MEKAYKYNMSISSTASLTALSITAALFLAACALPFSSSDDKAELITSFSFLAAHNTALSEDISGEIDGNDIILTVPAAIEREGLIASFESSAAFVTVGFARQESGVTPNDFNYKVKYRAHGDDETRDYYVTVNDETSTGVSVLSFGFADADNAALAADVNGSVNGTEIRLSVPFGTDLTALVANFTLSDGARASVSGADQSSGVTANDHSSDISFTVTSGSGSSLNYTVKTFTIVDLGQLSTMLGASQDVTRVDPSGITDMTDLFSDMTTFNQDIGDWDVSGLIIMDSMFYNASSFNQDISGWDLSGVQSMNGTFFGASSFNQDIGGWDVGSVTTMDSLFEQAVSFNRYIGSWDVSSVSDMDSMFQSASSFNQDIDGWDVGNVMTMMGMFDAAVSFNQNIASWQVGAVTNLDLMFNNASAFTTGLSAWSGLISETPIPTSFSSGSCPLAPADHPYPSWDS